jgi:hypothetical protein
VDGHDQVALVAESADGSQVGVARFVLTVDSESSADVVVTMVDAWYQHGVGPLLASSLVHRARRGRQRRFPLVLRPGNEQVPSQRERQGFESLVTTDAHQGRPSTRRGRRIEKDHHDQ